MTAISRSALVNFTPGEMFRLVDDIEHYPEFLPWCRQTTVISREENAVKASIELAKGGIRKKFTTCNRNQRDKMIEIQLVEGPFSHLHGYWHFTPLGDAGCKVALDMEFDFSSKLLELAIGPVFTQVVNSLIDAFVRRAQVIYGV